MIKFLEASGFLLVSPKSVNPQPKMTFFLFETFQLNSAKLGNTIKTKKENGNMTTWNSCHITHLTNWGLEVAA